MCALKVSQWSKLDSWISSEVGVKERRTTADAVASAHRKNIVASGDFMTRKVSMLTMKITVHEASSIHKSTK